MRYLNRLILRAAGRIAAYSLAVALVPSLSRASTSTSLSAPDRQQQSRIGQLISGLNEADLSRALAGVPQFAASDIELIDVSAVLNDTNRAVIDKVRLRTAALRPAMRAAIASNGVLSAFLSSRGLGVSSVVAVFVDDGRVVVFTESH